MDDIFDKVTSQQDIFKKIASYIPGFKGYVERQNRRSSDKLLREMIADRFEAIWKRISTVQTDLISQGEIAAIDDLERAAIKIRQFIDRVRTAAYGYAGLFDAVKVNETELATLYQFDLALLTLSDEVGGAIDNVESSVGSDGFPAALRNLTTVAQKCVDTYNKRAEILVGGGSQ